MTNSNVISLDREFDPWIHQSRNNQPVPETAKPVCIIELNVGIDTLNEVIWFNRTNDKDELWTLTTYDDSIRWPSAANASLLKRGRVAVSNRAGASQDSAYRLLRDFIQIRAGHVWPSGFIKPGMIDKQTFEKLMEETEDGFERNIKVARKLASPLIQVARKLGLGPQPLPNSITAWQAHCPGTNHYLFISTQSDTFGCGYCRRKGGEDELKAFVKQRSELKKAQGGRS